MMSTVFQFCMVLVAILNAYVSATCHISVTCRCGSSGISYARCVNETLLKHYSCERWANCQTCKTDSEFCETCPPGRSGPTCRDDVKEMNQQPVFAFGECPHLKPPKLGSIECKFSERQRSCTARCLPGFHFEDAENSKEITLTCDGNVWRPRRIYSDCKHDERSCNLRMSKPGFYNCTTGMDGTHCDITCEGKFQGRYHCYPETEWNTTLPFCVTTKVKTSQNTCLYPGIPRNGAILDLSGKYISPQRTFREGEAVKFLCNGPNSTILGSRTIFCRKGGIWSGSPPRCVNSQEVKNEKASCSDPGLPKDGGTMDLKGAYVQSQSVFFVGDVVLFFCNDKDSALRGNLSATCRSDGTWSSLPPRCIKSQKKLFCKHPGGVENGIIEDYDLETEVFPVGTQLRFQCREGYEMRGSRVIYCLRNVSWSETPPLCRLLSTTAPLESEAFCQHPGTIENGKIDYDEPSAELFPIGSVLTIHCLAGAIREGPGAIYCLLNGIWSEALPKCKRIPTTTEMKIKLELPCKHPGKIRNGIIEGNIPRTKTFPAGSLLRYKCRNGHEMEGPNTLHCLINGQWTSAKPTCRLTKTQRSKLGIFFLRPFLSDFLL